MKKVREAAANPHKKAFEVVVEDSGRLEFPYAQARPEPSSDDPVTCVEIDAELGEAGFAYRLESGAEGVVLSDHVLRYARDPAYRVEELLYELSCEARDRLEASSMGIRALARRLDTSPTQIYRLVDPAFYGKSLDQLVRLLVALGAEVEVDVRFPASG